MDELTKMYKEYEEVVVEHRAMKERARLKAEQEERERKAATRVSYKNHNSKQTPSLLLVPWPHKASKFVIRQGELNSQSSQSF